MQIKTDFKLDFLIKFLTTNTNFLILSLFLSLKKAVFAL